MNALDLLILNGPRYPRRHPNPSYKGTFRMQPGHFDSLPEDHEANLLFGWLLEEGGELGIVHDEAKARRLCDLCKVYAPNENYEVLEAVKGEDPPRLGGELLGYDISQGLNNSLLWWGLKTSGLKDHDDPVSILADTIFTLFARQLNNQGLFSDIETATQCRQSLIALQALRPNFIEGEDLHEFRVVGLYSLPPERTVPQGDALLATAAGRPSGTA
jgi:hypothetical protein